MSDDYWKNCSSCGVNFHRGFIGEKCEICYHKPSENYERWFCERCDADFEMHKSICRGNNLNSRIKELEKALVDNDICPIHLIKKQYVDDCLDGKVYRCPKC